MIATLFDFDGVLVDSEPVHLAAFRDVVLPLGITITDEDYVERYLGLDDYGVFRALLARAKYTISSERVRQLVAKKAPAFMERFASSVRVFEGAAEAVRRRASRGTVGIVSGALDNEVRFGLEQMGVANLVSFIVSAESCRACKPDPEGYLLAMAQLPAGTRAAVIEDSLGGVQAAKAAGLRCAAVAHSYAESALVAAGADVVARNIATLTDAMLDGAHG